MIASLHYMPAVFLRQWPNNTQPMPEPKTPELLGPKPLVAAEAKMRSEGKSETETPKIPEDHSAKLQEQAGKDLKVKSDVRRLINWENNVKQHEQAHMSVGGGLVGAARFSYTVGPDGKRYVAGGEVSISIPSSHKEEDNVQTFERVKRAALAPADPSPQDIKTAAMASALLTAAYQKLAKQKAEDAAKAEANGTTDPTAKPATALAS